MPEQRILSRSCIRDTFLAQKNGAYRLSGLALSLYFVNSTASKNNDQLRCSFLLFGKPQITEGLR